MKQVIWTADEALQATKGTLTPDQTKWQATGISIDSRTLGEGDLFVALKDKRDGYKFIQKAFEAGACAALTEKEHSSGSCLLVKDSLKALRLLAESARERSRALRIAVTGSVGKTTIKEMLRCVFRKKGKTHISLRSFNNHWGVPLSLASLPKSTEYGIFELGMNHFGEIEKLSKLVRPEISLISKIAPAHLAYFNSVDEIARAKSEIFLGQLPESMAVLNADQPYCTYLQSKARQRNIKTITFGSNKNSDVRLVQYQLEKQKGYGQIIAGEQKIDFECKAFGSHFGENANAVFAVGIAAGLTLREVSEGLSQFSPVEGRGFPYFFRVEGKEFTLIDESYNANPESMKAALKSLADYQPSAQGNILGGRKIAVLGDMLELGERSEAYHKEILSALIDFKIDAVIVCGEEIAVLWNKVPKRMKLGKADTPQCAYQLLKSNLEKGDIILVKGSNCVGLEKIVKNLKQDHKKSGEAQNVL